MGDAIYVLEYSEDRDNWCLRRKGGDALPVEGGDREEVLARARDWVKGHAPARLEVQDRNGLTEEELRFR